MVTKANKNALTPILVHLPADILGRLDAFSAQIGIARAELVRRCLRRDLSFVQDVELRQLQEYQQNCSAQYQKRMWGG